MFKVGDKAKGFKFDGDAYPLQGWDHEMNDVVGIVGEVSYVGGSSYRVHFEGIDVDWSYPRDLWYLGKTEETTVSDKVSFNVGERVKFKKSSIDSGMIDATEDDVFEVSAVFTTGLQIDRGDYFQVFAFCHFEHVKGSVMTNTGDAMNNTEEQEIKWRVGQEVFCLLRGKGVVHQIHNTGFYWSEGVDVYFMNRGNIRFKFDGTIGTGFNRSLFFSEPKIEAEKFPPKKPFVPKLKKGDVIFVKVKDELYGEGTVRTVHGELDDRIYISEKHHYFLKKDILSIRVLSEEIIFN